MHRRSDIAAAALTGAGLLALTVAVTPRAAGAQSTTPPAPTAPAPAPAPALPPVPTAENIEQIVNEALSLASSAQNQSAEAQRKSAEALAKAGQDFAKSIFTMSGSGAGLLSGKRVNVDLKDSGLRDALKKVLDDAKVTYKLDDDVTNDKKISLKTSDATLPTVLDLLTESGGLGWRSEVSAEAYAATIISGDRTATITAQPKPDGSAPSAKKADKPSVTVHVGKTVKSVPHNLGLGVMELRGLPGGVLDIKPPVAATGPIIVQRQWREQRVTFTCPNCHNTVTVVRAPHEDRCAKCGRAFQDDWQVCPYDGTKRPEHKDDLHFCPICGKAVKLDDAKTSWAPQPFRWTPALLGSRNLFYAPALRGDAARSGPDAWYSI